MILAQHLASIGQFLDMTEAGVIPLRATAYQTAARLAAQLIAEHGKVPEVIAVAKASPALAEIRSNQGLALALTHDLLPSLRWDSTQNKMAWPARRVGQSAAVAVTK